MKTFNHQTDHPKTRQSPNQLKEDKSIILYVLHKIKVGLSREQLSEIILRNIQINYFDLQAYIDELIACHYITEIKSDDEHREMILSEEGKNTIEIIAQDISSYIRELIDLYIEKNQSKIKNRVIVQAQYHCIGPGNYEAILSLFENDLSLIELKINTPTEKDAIALCKKWKRDHQKVYASIIQCLN